MFRMNLKIALRSLWKNKVSSFINVIGLAIGLSACLMLLVYVSYEWNFDRQSKNAEDVYLTMTHITDDAGKDILTFDGTTTAFAPLIKQSVPEVEYIARMNYGGKRLIANGTNAFKKEAKFAEPDILKMYDYQFLAGDPKTALSNPRSVILTEDMAKTLFGRTDVLNKSVRLRDKDNLTVTGVIKNVPDNSSNKFDFLMPWSFYEIIDSEARDLNWGNYSYVTLMRLTPGASMNDVNKKIDAVVRANTKSKTQPHFLFPLSDIHLHGKFVNGKSVGGDIEQVWLFIGLACGILLIACINFMNMATAKSERRAKEVGIKKTIGATRASLVKQFLTESMVLTLISVVIAIALVEIFLPSLNNLLGISLDVSYFNAGSWIAILGIVLLTGFTAGSYPAFYLSSFNPIQTLKRKIKGRSSLQINLRQVLIIGQFCFAIMLIISTMVIYKQLQYIKNKPVGADINVLLQMPQDGELKTKFEMLKSELLKSGAVENVMQTSIGLLHHGQNFNSMEWPGMSNTESSILFNRIGTTYDFIKTSGLKLIAGRDFDKAYASDTAAVLIGASAVKTMGLKQPLGAKLKMSGENCTVIGVFKDYVWDSPYKSNHPMIIYFNRESTGTITMRVKDADNLQHKIETIERITREINPAFPVEISFTSDLYNELLKKEKVLGVLSNLFGGLAILISCLGLFGLVAYSAEQRTKEFGVRKVLGASVYSLMQLLSWSFFKMIFIAIIIAVPLSWYAMELWLQKYEFHTNMSWWVVVVAAAGTLLVALLTISYQSYKVATANPVDALKYE
jgi:putative ABC transport system permease protein